MICCRVLFLLVFQLLLCMENSWENSTFDHQLDRPRLLCSNIIRTCQKLRRHPKYISYALCTVYSYMYISIVIVNDVNVAVHEFLQLKQHETTGIFGVNGGQFYLQSWMIWMSKTRGTPKSLFEWANTSTLVDKSEILATPIGESYHHRRESTRMSYSNILNAP